MRLIADENISWRLKNSYLSGILCLLNEIKTDFRLSDKMIWEFAKANQFAILIFDEDFSDLQNIYFYQPKIIWLRTGNVATAEVAALLLKFEDRINKFLEDNESGIYKIHD